MLISIDESGTFAEANKVGSWCVVAAYTFTERRKSSVYAALVKAKTSCGRRAKQEIKLKNLQEIDYFNFLNNLRMAGGALFAVATDGGLNTYTTIEAHRKIQVEKIRMNIPRMIYEEGKIAVVNLVNEIETLSPQLYIQMQCQVTLIKEVLARSILFYVQRDPKTLRRFVWRIDQKNTNKTIFERAFAKVTPAILQSVSFREPMIFLEGEDYSYFRPFMFSEGEYPEYLQEEFGYEPQSAINLGKLLRDDLSFPDSKLDTSVQVADLLASGIRRCLRGGFSDNQTAAILLGRLMVQNIKQSTPLNLVCFGNTDLKANRVAEDAVIRMTRNTQRMLYPV